MTWRFYSLAAAAMFLALSATGASAQATRTWVSGVGDDANPCSRTAPCKTFAGAISKTATNGVIDVLDPGGFGAVTITKGITIRAVGVEAGITASLTRGVIVNAPNASVNLIGLNIDGVDTGLHGVDILAARNVTIANCRISRFRSSAATGAGVRLATTAAVRVLVLDSLLAGNFYGVDIQPQGNGVNTAVLENTVIEASHFFDLRGSNNKAAFVLRRTTALGPVDFGAASVTTYGDNAFDPSVVLPAATPLR